MHNTIKFLILTLLAAPALGAAVPAKNKFIGAVIGSAIGDALGRLTEFEDTMDKIQEKYGPQGLKSFNQFKRKEWIDGQALYTDDTVMARILLEEALNHKKNKTSQGFFLSSYAQRCIELFGNQKFIVDPYYNLRAHGPTNIKGCKQLEPILSKNLGRQFNKPWWNLLPKDAAHTYYPDIKKEGGCGSVMRAWPLGLVFFDNLPLIKDLANQQSIITHRHPMARAASVAIAVGTACALNGMPVESIVHEMICAAAEFDEEEKLYKPNAIKLGDTITFDPKLVAQNTLLTSDMIHYAYHMALQGKTPDLILGTHNLKQAANYRSPDGFLLGWAADEAVAAAVYVFARHSTDLQNAIIEGVNTPGDSDSIAALAAALVGAYSGIESLDKAGFDYSRLEKLDELLELAEQAYKAA